MVRLRRIASSSDEEEEKQIRQQADVSAEKVRPALIPAAEAAAPQMSSFETAMVLVKRSESQAQGLNRLYQMFQEHRAPESSDPVRDLPAAVANLLQSCRRADTIPAVVACLTNPDGAVREAAAQVAQAFATLHAPPDKLHSFMVSSQLPAALISLIPKDSRSSAHAESAPALCAMTALLVCIKLTPPVEDCHWMFQFTSVIPALLRIMWKGERICQTHACLSMCRIILGGGPVLVDAAIDAGAPTQLVAIMTDERSWEQKVMAAEIVICLAGKPNWQSNSRAHQTLYAAGIIPALAVLLCQSSDRASKAIPLKALNEMDKALDCDDWARAKKPLKDIASYVNGWDLLSNLSGEDDPDACDEITYCSIRLLHSVCKYASYDLSTMENAQRLLSLAQRSTSAAVIANAIGRLAEMFRNEHLVAVGFIPVCIELLRHCSREVCKSAILGLSILTSMYPAAGQLIADAGGIIELVRCSDKGDKQMQEVIKYVLGHLAKSKGGKQKIKAAQCQLGK